MVQKCPGVLLIPILALLASLTACSPAPLTAVFTTQVDSAGRALNESSTFSIDTPTIICSVYVAGLPPASGVKTAWQHYDGNAWRPIQENTLTVAGSTYLVFSLNSPPAGWQTGDYSVKLSLNDRPEAEKRFAVQTDKGVTPPAVNNFTATPATVTLGQPLTLSWNVTGASRVVIEPDIGSVNAGGSKLVSPQADTTFMLTALNSGGSSSISASVTVLAPVTERPDLVVVDIFRQLSMVYYRVRNDGNAVSKPSSANLYMNRNLLGSGYIPPLAPGELRTLTFGGVVWSFIQPTPATVCIDTANENNEISKDNNCLIIVLPAQMVL